MEEGQFMEEGVKMSDESQAPDGFGASVGKSVLTGTGGQSEDLPKTSCRSRAESGGSSVRGKEEADSANSLRQAIAGAFPGKRQDIRSYSALTLAYIGDVVYDLVIRTVVVGKGNRPVNDLHRITVKYVSATAQAKMVQALSGSLTEEEKSIFQRGKNAKPHTTAKNASVSDYLKATGFEAVIGYLYLTDNMGRVLELVKEGITLAGMEI